MKRPIINALCIDVDDLYTALVESFYTKNTTNIRKLPKYVNFEILKTLDYFDKLEIKATFFIPGHFLENFPSLVKEIYTRTHQVASHGMTHDFMDRVGVKKFKAEIKESRFRLEDIISDTIDTFKAPLWGISHQSLWVYDCLLEAGFKVDHSAMPVVKQALQVETPHNIPFYYQEELVIIPPTTIRILGKELPFCGGFYNAYIPYSIQRYYYNYMNSNNITFNYYCHPFEIFPYLSKMEKFKLVPDSGLYPYLYSFHSGRYKKLIGNLSLDFSLTTLKEAYSGYY